MRAAFRKVGVLPRNTEFMVAISKYTNQGGSFDEMRRLINDAEALAKGQSQSADNGRATLALGEQSVEDARGRHVYARYDGLGKLAPPSSPNRDGGQLMYASNGPIERAPVREPSASQRKADLEARKVIRLTILDTHKIRDGRAIGDVRYGEIEQLRAANAVEASIFRQIQRRIGYADHDCKLRDLLKPEDFNAIKQKAAEISDAM
jgi:hypothetical protein